MSGSTRITVAPGILAWARATSGVDTATTAKRLQVSEATVTAWEQGTAKPTIAQLRKLAALHQRPLVVLLLPHPPKDFEPLQDFRRIPTQQDRAWSARLHAAVKRAVTQREVVLELAELSPSSLPDGAEGVAVPKGASAEQAGEHLRVLLSMDRWSPAVWSNERAVLKAAVDATERLGVLVLQTQGIDISEMRGFSFSARPHPVVVLNGSDGPRPRLFTLLHELCHIALNAGGLCDLHEPKTGAHGAEDQTEHFCNAAAASALMPRARLLADPMVRDAGSQHDWTIDELSQLCQRYGASTETALLRLVQLGLAGWGLYRKLRPELARRYAEARQRREERQTGGPSYFMLKARNLGHGYVRSVLDAFQSHAISSLDVADYLDVRFDQLPKLQAVVQH